MLEIIYWIFEKIGQVTSFALNFYILGNLSLLHFIIGFGLLGWLISFLTFGNYNIDTTLRMGSILNEKFTNIENKRDKLNYVNESVKVNYVTTFPDKVVTRSVSSYRKFNPKTGKREKTRPANFSVVATHRLKGREW